MSTDSEKGENRTETVEADNESAEKVSSKTDFLTQIETAFEKQLPPDVDINAFVEKVIDSYLASPPPQKYTDDFFLDIIKPVMVKIIRLKDGLAKDINSFNEILRKNGANEAITFANELLKSISEEYDDVLEYYNVTPFKVEDNKFNPLKQTVVKTIPTDDESLFKIVSESLSYGYERNGRVISKERVAAYVVEKATEQQEV